MKQTIKNKCLFRLLKQKKNTTILSAKKTLVISEKKTTFSPPSIIQLRLCANQEHLNIGISPRKQYKIINLGRIISSGFKNAENHLSSHQINHKNVKKREKKKKKKKTVHTKQAASNTNQPAKTKQNNTYHKLELLHFSTHLPWKRSSTY